MAAQPQDVRDLLRSQDTSSLAFGGNGPWHLVLFRFEDGRLVETDGGRVDGHVTEDDVGVGCPDG